MWADILTKEKHLSPELEDVLMGNMMDPAENNNNEVLAVGTEIQMKNIKNRRAVESESKV